MVICITNKSLLQYIIRFVLVMQLIIPGGIIWGNMIHTHTKIYDSNTVLWLMIYKHMIILVNCITSVQRNCMQLSVQFYLNELWVLCVYMLLSSMQLTLKVLNVWKFTWKWNGWFSDSHCSVKPLWSGIGKVVPAHTSLTLHPPSPPTVM